MNHDSYKWVILIIVITITGGYSTYFVSCDMKWFDLITRPNSLLEFARLQANQTSLNNERRLEQTRSFVTLYVNLIQYNLES